MILFASLFISIGTVLGIAWCMDWFSLLIPEKEKPQQLKKTTYSQRLKRLKKNADFPGGIIGVIITFYGILVLLFIVGIPYYEKWMYNIYQIHPKYYGILNFSLSTNGIAFHIFIGVIVFFLLLSLLGVLQKFICILIFNTARFVTK